LSPAARKGRYDAAAMDAPRPTDRRRHGRDNVRPGRQLPIRYRRGDHAWRTTTTRNIGVGGAFVETPDEPALAIGSALALELRLPTRTVTLDAAVRWCGDGGVGVQFVAVDIDILLELSAYFDSGGDGAPRPA